MIRTILFDLDGTIIDSEKVAFQSILECYSGWGITIDPSDAAIVAGKKWEVAFDLLFRKYPLPLSQAEASVKIIQRYQKNISENLQTIPGVLDAIRFFAKDHNLGLVSGSHREDILWALETLKVRDLFKVVLGAEDYVGSKPAPDGYQKALELFQEEPHRALVFEDSHAGVSSAVAAGIPVVAVTAANHFGHNLDHATAIIPHFLGVNAQWLADFKAQLAKKKS
jgi:HAD superfamily hydrolase (TIGR01509 family)